ncbi:MAG: nicotinamide mononucleotide transporter family protein, partial [Muribaculaceae bacterium]|nr:nicotinamide mononucleotide transporter family protein [Muribaculaceae bacterium]
MYQYLEIAGFLLGILYLWWEFHADRRMWIAGLLMPMLSMAVYYSKGLYADFAMNIYY